MSRSCSARAPGRCSASGDRHGELGEARNRDVFRGERDRLKRACLAAPRRVVELRGPPARAGDVLLAEHPAVRPTKDHLELVLEDSALSPANGDYAWGHMRAPKRKVCARLS